MSKNQTTYHLVKCVTTCDNTTKPQRATIHYEYCGKINGTDSQVNKHCITLDKEDPNNKALKKLKYHEFPSVFTRVSHEYVEDTENWSFFFTTTHGLRGYDGVPTATLKLMEPQWIGILTALAREKTESADQIIYEIINGINLNLSLSTYDKKDIDVVNAYNRAKSRQEELQRKTQENINKLDLSKLEDIT